MDPNATLTRIRELVNTIVTEGPYETGYEQELAEAVNALDDWLSKGGFKPAAWTRIDITNTKELGDYWREQNKPDGGRY